MAVMIIKRKQEKNQATYSALPTPKSSHNVQLAAVTSALTQVLCTRKLLSEYWRCSLANILAACREATRHPDAENR